MPSSPGGRVGRRAMIAGLGAGFGVGVVGLTARAQVARSAPEAYICTAAGRAETASLRPGVGPWRAGLPLIEPESRRSMDGVLQTTLRVGYAYKEIGGFKLYLRTYEGMIPGPTMRVKPGDRLRIRLENNLPPDRDITPADMSLPHHFNTTNFHLHGSHVAPDGNSDNIFRTMLPGEGYDIEIDLPEDHPSGVYWYHPHHHGGADVQIASGMAGAVIIEGDFDAVPEIAQATERTLVVSEVVFDRFGMVEQFERLFPEGSMRFFSVNGQREPTIAMRPGEVQRWRLVHAGYQDNMFLELQQHALNVIALDGVALPVMRQHDRLLVAPGQRVDLLVQAGTPGTYALQALPHDQGYPSPTGVLANLMVAGVPMPMALPHSLPAPPLRDIADDEVTGRRTVTLSAKPPQTEAAADWQEFRFLVDGRQFDHDRVDQRVRLGAVEEWTIRNEHFHDHIFHIHINPFQVTMLNGKPVEPEWRDTVVVPRHGSLTFRTRFVDFPGKFVLHCHMMNHEEMGMMQVVEVIA